MSLFLQISSHPSEGESKDSSKLGHWSLQKVHSPQMENQVCEPAAKHFHFTPLFKISDVEKMAFCTFPSI